jgi:predicted AAA+ superfamily ATPase
MVFLGGPRQVGKTTFSQSLLKNGHQNSAYFNWDSAEHREIILKGQWPATEKLIILDELHKYARWRNLIKGFYDTQKSSHQFLVTGSARLDYYRKGGDSLMGRYHYFRMHPFSLGELGYSKDSLENLIKFGGFPEPLFAQKEKTLRRWQLQRLERIIREDLIDLERVKEISLLERLAEALPDRVGSPLSVKNLSQDLMVDFKTAERWVTILENLYYAFRIPPYGAPKIKAVKKEQKLYLWDWSAISSAGAKFENLVASQLLKYCHFEEDSEGHRMELRFIRDVYGREVDFVVLKNKKPIFAVECKTGEKQLSSVIPYLIDRTDIPHFYQIHLGTKHYSPHPKAEVIPFIEFCKKLNLP